MSVDDLLDDWDENFIKDIIQVELDATSSRNPATSSLLPLEQEARPPVPFPEQGQPIRILSRNPTTSLGCPISVVPLPGEGEGAISARNPTWVRLDKESFTGRCATSAFGFDGGVVEEDCSFSPPRELSQRILEKPESSNTSNDCEIVEPGVCRNGVGGYGVWGGGGVRKDMEVERLKRELGRVSKKLNHMEHECMELRKDRSKKDEQLKCAFSKIKDKDAEINSLKRPNLEASKQDQSSLPLNDTSISTDQVGCVYPISEDICTRSIPQAWKGTDTKLPGNSKKVIGPTGELLLDSQMFENYGTKRKEVQTGLFEVSELKRRTMIDNSATTSSGCSVQERSFPIKSVLPHCTKDVGIQTEVDEDCSRIAVKDEPSVHHNISIKLTSIWDLPADKSSKRNLVSNLFVTCSADFYVLFRFMGTSSEISPCSVADESLSDAALHDCMQSIQLVDAAKVSRLYTTIMKIRNEMAQLDNLLEALTDLCLLENVVIVHRSLRIVHAILQHMFGISSDKRDHFVITQSLNNNFLEEKKSIGPKKKAVVFNEFENAYNGCKACGLFSSSVRSFHMEQLCKDGSSNNGTSLSLEHCISLFETMHRITARHTEEHIQVEALSIMNLILMRSNPLSEREKFGLIPQFESLSVLLRKEVGFQVQKQAVRLLFLLLNCPKLLTMLWSGYKDDAEHSDGFDGENHALTLQGLSASILEGLAECIACKGNGTQELKLRKDAIIVLAFLASSSKYGFKILLNSVTTQGVSFLELIIQVLASEMDAEAGDFAESPGLCKERTALIREGLILLNRLASNATYSKAILGALTSSRATASLTVDVANRMARKSRGGWKLDSTQKTQSKEAEIVDLARLFRTRVLSFLGEGAT